MLLVGLAIALWVASPTERRRRSVVGELELGDSLSQVVARLGEPGARCPGGALAHLAPAFPPGWPAASVEAALQTLAAETAERWVYPVRPGRGGGCAARDGQTELGIDRGGRLLWYVAITGKTPLRLPGKITPAAPAGAGTAR